MGIKEKMTELTNSAKNRARNLGTKVVKRKREIGAAVAAGIFGLSLGTAIRTNRKDDVRDTKATPEQAITEQATAEQVNPEKLAEIDARLAEIESMIESIGGKVSSSGNVEDKLKEIEGQLDNVSEALAKADESSQNASDEIKNKLDLILRENEVVGGVATAGAVASVENRELIKELLEQVKNSGNKDDQQAVMNTIKAERLLNELTCNIELAEVGLEKHITMGVDVDLEASAKTVEQLIESLGKLKGFVTPEKYVELLNRLENINTKLGACVYVTYAEQSDIKTYFERGKVCFSFEDVGLAKEPYWWSFHYNEGGKAVNVVLTMCVENGETTYRVAKTTGEIGGKYITWNETEVAEYDVEGNQIKYKGKVCQNVQTVCYESDNGTLVEDMAEEISSAEFDGEKWTLKTKNNDDVTKVEILVDSSVDDDSKYREIVMYDGGEEIARGSIEDSKEIYKQICDQFGELQGGKKLTIIGTEEQK